MITYLLDTDIVSYLTKHKYPDLQNRYRQLPEGSVAISAVTEAEILFGLEAFPAFHPSRFRAVAFLESLPSLDWPSGAASAFAAAKHATRQQPIGDLDCMIAAHAMALDIVLVTNNTAHFSRVGHPLRLENWVAQS